MNRPRSASPSEEPFSEALARLVRRARNHDFDRDAAIRAVSEVFPGSTSEAELPPEEARFIAEHGGLSITGPNPEWLGDYAELVVETVTQFARHLLTTRQVADRLGVSVRRVRRQHIANAVIAYRLGGALYFPDWQLVQTESGDWMPLPWLSKVIDSIPSDAHPFSISAMMTIPQRELSVGAQSRTPKEWLAAGRPVEPVVALLSESGDRW